MSDGLARMPGHRAAPDAQASEPGALAELLPFLPNDYEAAMPLYISMALLFIVISRAARRRTKVRMRQKTLRMQHDQKQAVSRRGMQSVGAPGMRPHDGHWGDG